MFTYEKKVRALQLYEQTHSVTETIRILGYPERATLYRWISEKGQPEKVRSTKRGENPQDFCLFFHKKVALQKGRMYNKNIRPVRGGGG